MSVRRAREGVDRSPRKDPIASLDDEVEIAKATVLQSSERRRRMTAPDSARLEIQTDAQPGADTIAAGGGDQAAAVAAAADAPIDTDPDAVITIVPVVKKLDLAPSTPVGTQLAATCMRMQNAVKKVLARDMMDATVEQMYKAEDFVGAVYQEKKEGVGAGNAIVYLQVDTQQWVPLDVVDKVASSIHLGAAKPARLHTFVSEASVPEVDVIGGVDGKLELTEDPEMVGVLVGQIRKLIQGELPVPTGMNPLGVFSDDAIYIAGDLDARTSGIVKKCVARYDAAGKIIHIPRPTGATHLTVLTEKIKQEKAAVKKAGATGEVVLIWANQGPDFRVYQAGCVAGSSTTDASAASANPLWANAAAKDPATANSGAPSGLASFTRKMKNSRAKIIENRQVMLPEADATYSSAVIATGVAASVYAKHLSGATDARYEEYVWRRRYAHSLVGDGDADDPGNLFIAARGASTLLSAYDLYVRMLLGNCAEDAEEGDGVFVRTELVAPKEKTFGHSAQKGGTWWMRHAPDAVRVTISEATDVKARMVVPCDWSHKTSKFFTALLKTVCEEEAFEAMLVEAEGVGGGALKEPEAAAAAADNQQQQLDILHSSVTRRGASNDPPRSAARTAAAAARKRRKRAAMRRIRAAQAIKNATKDKENRAAAGGAADGADTPAPPQTQGDAAAADPQQIDDGSPFLKWVGLGDEPLNATTIAQKEDFDGVRLATLVGVKEVMNFADMDEAGMTAFRKAAVVADPNADKYFPKPGELPEDTRVVQGDVLYWGMECSIKSFVKFYNNGMIGHLTGLYQKKGSFVKLPASLTGERIVFIDQPARRGQLDLAGNFDLSKALDFIDFPSGIAVDLAGGFENIAGYDALMPGQMPTKITGTLDRTDSPIELGGPALQLKTLEIGINMTDEVTLAVETAQRIFTANIAATADLTIGSSDPIELEVAFSGGPQDAPVLTGKIGTWTEPLGLKNIQLEEAEVAITLKPFAVEATATLTLTDVVKFTVAGSWSKEDGGALSGSIDELSLTAIAGIYQKLTGGDAMTVKGDEGAFKFENLVLSVTSESAGLQCELTYKEKYKAAASITFGKEEGLQITGSMSDIDLGSDIVLNKVALDMQLPPGSSEEPFIQGLADFTIPVIDSNVKLLFRLGRAGKCGAVSIDNIGFSLGMIHESLAWLEFGFPSLMFGYSDTDGLQIAVDDQDVELSKGMSVTGVCTCSMLNKLLGDTVELGFKFTLEGKKAGPIDITFGAPPVGSVSDRLEAGSGLPIISVDPSSGTLTVAFGTSVTIFDKRVGMEGGFTVTFGPPMGVSLFGRVVVEDPGLRIGADSSTLYLKQVGASAALLPVPGCVTLFGQFNFGKAATAAAVLRLHPTIPSQDAVMVEIRNATFRDVIDLAPNLVGIDPLPKLPLEEQFKKLHQLKLSIAPVDMPPITFGDITMNPGICFAGDIEAFGQRAKFMLEISGKKFILEASLRDAFELADILKISSSDGKRGPYFYIKVNTGVFELKLDGAIELLGQRMYAKVNIAAPSTIEFDCGFTILGIGTRLQGKKDDDGKLWVRFELGDAQRKKAKEKVLKEVKAAVLEMIKEAKRSEGTGKELVKAYYDGLERLKKDLATAKANLLAATEAMEANAEFQLKALDEQQRFAEADVQDVARVYEHEVGNLEKELQEARENCRSSVQKLRRAFDKAKRLREKHETTFARDMKTATNAFNKKLGVARTKAQDLERAQARSAKAFKVVEAADPGKCCKCSCKHKKRWEQRIANAKRDLKRAKLMFEDARYLVDMTIVNWDKKRQSMMDRHATKLRKLLAAEQEQQKALREQEKLYAQLTAACDASKLGEKLAERHRVESDFAQLNQRFSERQRVLEATATSDRKANLMILDQALAQFRKLKQEAVESQIAQTDVLDDEQRQRAKTALRQLAQLTADVKPLLRDEILPAVHQLQGAMKGIGVRYAVITKSGGHFAPTPDDARAIVAGLDADADRLVMGTNGELIHELSDFDGIAEERDLVIEGLKFLKVAPQFATCWMLKDGSLHFEEFHLHYDAMEKSREVATVARARLVMDIQGKLFPQGCADMGEAVRMQLVSYAYNELSIAFVLGALHGDTGGEVHVERCKTWEKIEHEVAVHTGRGGAVMVFDEQGGGYAQHTRATAEEQVKIEGAVLTSLGIDFVLASIMESNATEEALYPSLPKAKERVRGIPQKKSYIGISTRGVEEHDISSVRSDHVRKRLTDRILAKLDNEYLVCTLNPDGQSTTIQWFKTLRDARARADALADKQRVLMDKRGKIYASSSSPCSDQPKYLMDAFEAIKTVWHTVQRRGDGQVALASHSTWSEALRAKNTALTSVLIDNHGTVYDVGTHLRPVEGHVQKASSEFGSWRIAKSDGTRSGKITFKSSMEHAPQVMYGLSSLALRTQDPLGSESTSTQVEAASVSRQGFQWSGQCKHGVDVSYAALNCGNEIAMGTVAMQALGWTGPVKCNANIGNNTRTSNQVTVHAGRDVVSSEGDLRAVGGITDFSMDRDCVYATDHLKRWLTQHPEFYRGVHHVISLPDFGKRYSPPEVGYDVQFAPNGRGSVNMASSIPMRDAIVAMVGAGSTMRMETLSCNASVAWMLYNAKDKNLQSGTLELTSTGATRVEFPVAMVGVPDVTVFIQAFKYQYLENPSEVGGMNAAMFAEYIAQTTPPRKHGLDVKASAVDVSQSGFNLCVEGKNIKYLRVQWLASRKGPTMVRNKQLEVGPNAEKAAERLQQDTLRFAIRCRDDCHLYFGKGIMQYEIILGGWGGETNRFRVLPNNDAHTYMGRLLAEDAERVFWMQWKPSTRQIVVGHGRTIGQNVMFTHQHPDNTSPLHTMWCSSVNTTDPRRLGTFYFELSDRSLIGIEEQQVYNLAREQPNANYLMAHVVHGTLQPVQWFRRKADAVVAARAINIDATTTARVVMDIHAHVYDEGTQSWGGDATAFILNAVRRTGLQIAYWVANECGEEYPVAERLDTISDACKRIAELPDNSSHMLLNSKGKIYHKYSFFLDVEKEQLLRRIALEKAGAGLILCYRDYYKIRTERFYNFDFDKAFQRARSLPGSVNRVLMDTFGNVIEGATAFSDGNVVQYETRDARWGRDAADPDMERVFGVYARSTVSGLSQNSMTFRLRGKADAGVALCEGNDVKHAKYELVLAPGGTAARAELRAGINGPVLATADAPAALLNERKFHDFWFARNAGQHSSGRFTFGTGSVVGRNVVLAYEPGSTTTKPFTSVAVATNGASGSWQLHVEELRANGFLIDTPDSAEYYAFAGRVVGAALRFSLKARCGARIAMGTEGRAAAALFEVEIGSNNNTMSLLRNTATGEVLGTLNQALLDKDEYEEFWLKYDMSRRRLSFGRGGVIGQAELFSTTVAVMQCPFRHVFIKTEGATGAWCFRTDNVKLQTPAGTDYANKVAATQPGQTRVRINVRAHAGKDVFLGFAQENDPGKVLYEVGLGTGGADYVQLRDARVKHWGADLKCFGRLAAPLDSNSGNDFWVTWSPVDKKLRVGAGRQAGLHDLVTCVTDVAATPLRYVFMTSLSGAAEWHVLDDQEYILSRAELVARMDPSFDGEEFFSLDRPVRLLFANAARLARQSTEQQLREARKTDAPDQPYNPSPGKYVAVFAETTEGFFFFDELASGLDNVRGSGKPCLVFDESTRVVSDHCTQDSQRWTVYTRYVKDHLKQAPQFRVGVCPDAKDAAIAVEDCYAAGEALQRCGTGRGGAIVTCDGKVLVTWGGFAQIDAVLRRMLEGVWFVAYESADEAGVAVTRRFLSYRAASNHLKRIRGGDKLITNSRGRVVDGISRFSDTMRNKLTAATTCAAGGVFLLCTEHVQMRPVVCTVTADPTAAAEIVTSLAKTSENVLAVDNKHAVVEGCVALKDASRREVLQAAAVKVQEKTPPDQPLVVVVAYDELEPAYVYTTEEFVSCSGAESRVVAMGLDDHESNYLLVDSVGEVYKALSHTRGEEAYMRCKQHALAALGVGVIVAIATSGGIEDQRWYCTDESTVEALRAVGDKPALAMDSNGNTVLDHCDDPEVKMRLRAHVETAMVTDPGFRNITAEEAHKLAKQVSEGNPVAMLDKQKEFKGVTAGLRRQAAEALNGILENHEVLERVDRRILDLKGLLAEFDAVINNDLSSDVAELMHVLDSNTPSFIAGLAFEERAEQLEFLTALNSETMTAAVEAAITWSAAEQQAFIRMNANLALLRSTLNDPRFRRPAAGDEFVAACKALTEVTDRTHGLYPRTRPYIQRMQQMFGQAPVPDTHYHMNTPDQALFMIVGHAKNASLSFSVQAAANASLAFHSDRNFATEAGQCVISIGGNANHTTTMRRGLDTTGMTGEGATLATHEGVLLDVHEATDFWVSYEGGSGQLSFGIGNAVGQGKLLEGHVGSGFSLGYVAIQTSMGATGRWAFPVGDFKPPEDAGEHGERRHAETFAAAGTLEAAKDDPLVPGVKAADKVALVGFRGRPTLFMGMSGVKVPAEVRHAYLLGPRFTRKSEFGWDAAALPTGEVRGLDASWIAVTNPSIETGVARVVSDKNRPLSSHNLSCTAIDFKNEFKAPPRVVLGTLAVDMDVNEQTNYRVTADGVTKDGFMLKGFEDWGGRVCQVKVAWVAFPAGAAVQGGTHVFGERDDVGTHIEASPGKEQVAKTRIRFAEGHGFKAAPQVACMVAGYNARGSKTMDFTVAAEDIDADGFDLKYTVRDGTLHELHVQWIAVADVAPRPEDMKFKMAPLQDAIDELQDTLDGNTVEEADVVDMLNETAHAFKSAAATTGKQTVSRSQMDAQRRRVDELRKRMHDVHAANNRRRRAMYQRQRELRSKYDSDRLKLAAAIHEELQKLSGVHDLLRKYLAKSYEQEMIVEEQRDLCVSLKTETAHAIADVQDYAARLAPARSGVSDAEDAIHRYEDSPLARNVQKGTDAMKSAAHNAEKAAAIYEQMMRKASFTIGTIVAEAKIGIGGECGLDLEFSLDINFDFALHIDLGLFDFWIRLPKFSFGFSINFGEFIKFIKNIAKEIINKIKEAF